MFLTRRLLLFAADSIHLPDLLRQYFGPSRNITARMRVCLSAVLLLLEPHIGMR